MYIWVFICLHKLGHILIYLSLLIRYINLFKFINQRYLGWNKGLNIIGLILLLIIF